ncbi:hypothetical protein HOY81_25460 [Streptomyces sp. JJ36]|nr:hypothetical protein [Streptomyces sp. JJ36]
MGATALGLVLLLGVAGCGGAEEFTVTEACGARVDPDTVAPLLPEGEKLEIEDTLSEPGKPRCKFYVDGELTLYLRGDVVETGFDPLEASEEGMGRLGDPAPADIGDGALLADHGAKVVRACTYEGERRQYVLSFDGVDHPEDTGDRRKAIERFARSYLPSALKAHDCRAA